MDPERYRRLRDVVQRAGELEGDARSRLLADACGDDPGLRRDAERILAQDSVDTAALAVAAPGAATQAAPDRMGPYRIGPEIGRGGMGVVHLAHDERDGRRVAVKLLHAHLVSGPGVRERFAREARAGSRVVHPNVVGTIGTVESREGAAATLALVLEHVEGRDLRQVLDDLGTVPEALVREIGAQVASGLAAIHAAGLVHRDVKPENVLLTDDNRVRIADLGVAKLDGTAASLTAAGRFVGTVLYASPEQIDLRDVDGRSDLYSLGVVLYELATGSNPFARESPVATVRAHADLVPRLACEVRGDVTPFLAEVLATLLAKDAADRFESADRLRGVLAEGEAGAWWAARRERAAAARRAARVDVAREIPLCGRDREVAVLRAAWAAARGGAGRTVVVEGEPGTGRTRLVAAFLDSLPDGEAHVLYGEEAGAAAARNAVEEAVAACAGTPDLAGALDRILGRGGPAPRAADGPTCCAVLRKLAAERPVVWVVDDLHLAPASARSAVRAMARIAGSLRVLLVLTSRPGLATEDVADVARTPGSTRVVLGPLDADGVAAVLRSAFANDSIAQRLAGPLLRASLGLPGDLVGIVRELERDGFVLRLPGGGAATGRPPEELRIPAGTVERVRARLAALSRAEREVLDVAAVQGVEFDAAVVAEVTGGSLVGVLQTLAETERRRGLVRSVGRRHRFDPAGVHDVVYDGLPERLREEYHALVAEATARRAGDPPAGADAVTIAHHHVRGPRPERAAGVLGAALDHLGALRRPEAAADLIRRVLLRMPPADPAERAGLLLRQSALLDAAQDRRGQRDAALAALAEAEAVGEPLLRARAARAVARCEQAVFAHERALPWLLRAAEHARSAGDEVSAIESAISAGEALARLHRSAEAEEELGRCLAAARTIGSARLEGLARAHLGLVAALGPRAGESLTHLRAAARLLREGGDGRALGMCLARLGTSCLELRLDAEADAALAEAVAIAESIGDREVEGAAVGGRGMAALDRGRLGEALRWYVRAQEIGTELGNQGMVAHSVWNVGHVLGLVGRTSDAIDAVGRALGIAEEHGMAALENHALCRRAMLWAESGETDRAVADLERSIARARQIGDGFAEADAGVELAWVLHGAGAPARDVLARLRAARDLAVDAEAPIVAAFAEVHAAAVPGGDPDGAERLFLEFERDFSFVERLWGRSLLWQATRRDAHLEAAHTMIGTLREHAPPECRESLVANCFHHRVVEEAWAERRASG